MAVAAPLVFLFTRQDVLATLADDSASYLTLADFLSGRFSRPHIAAWAGWHSNFPPGFPLLLALTGGAHDLVVANAVIAACAVASLVLLYRYVSRERGPTVGLAVVVFFLLTATAWISLKGVLSEATYLMFSLGALGYYEMRLAGRGAVAGSTGAAGSTAAAGWEWLVFGVLGACVYLTRAIGLALFAAYAVHMALRFWSERGKAPRLAWLPVVPVVVLVGLWYALRPTADVDNYGRLATSVSSWWREDPAAMLEAAMQFFFAGWVRSFLADNDVAVLSKVVFAGVGVLSLAGLALRLRRNRLDAWFVLFSLVAVFIWTFGPDASRRLLYPFVPLLIFFAVDAVGAAFAHWRVEPRRRFAITLAIAVLPVMLCMPAIALIAEKSADRRPVLAGCPHTYRDITDYYTWVNREAAEAVSGIQVAMLCGLGSLSKVTPPGSTVMWIRPEYVAVVGGRNAAAYFYRWTPAELEQEIRRLKVDYLVVSQVFKNDLAGGKGREIRDMGEDAYSTPIFSLGEGGIFVVKQIRGPLLRGQTTS